MTFVSGPSEEHIKAAEARLSEICQMLRGCANLGVQLRSETNAAPADRSQILDEQTHAWSRSVDAFQMAIGNLIVVEDALEGLARLLDPPEAVFAPQVLVRLAMENAARAWWLLDPEINGERRAARYLNHRVRSLKHSISVSLSEEGLDRLKARLDSLWREVEDMPLSIVYDRKSRPAFVEERPPTSTDLMRSFLGHLELGNAGVLAYRQFSAVSHGTHAGILENIWLIHQPQPGKVGGGHPHLTLSHIESYVSIATLSWLFAMSKAVQVGGWDMGVWKSWLDHALGLLGRGTAAAG